MSGDARSAPTRGPRAWALAAALCAPLALGCAWANGVMKASPAAPQGFLVQPEALAPPTSPHYPFQRVRVAEGADLAAYDRILVAPVDVSHLRLDDAWERLNLRGAYLPEDAQALAALLRQRVAEQFARDPRERFQVVEAPGPRTLRVELSLVELVPAKAWLGTLGLAAWGYPLLQVAIPVGTAAALTQGGSVAIEGMVRDAQSGRVLLELADREGSRIRILDLRSLTWYGGAREAFDIWSEQLLAVLGTPPDAPVEDTSFFSWLPW